MKRKASTNTLIRQNYNTYKKRKVPPPATVTRNPYIPLATRGYRLNPVEKKVFDRTMNGFGADNLTGTAALLCNPVLGSDMNQRIGRKIIMKSIYIRGCIKRTPSINMVNAIVGPYLGRMILVYDQQPNGAAIAASDVLDNVDSWSHLKLDNRDRFKILYDKEFALDSWWLDAPTAGNWNRDTQAIKKYKKLNLEVIFSSSTGTIGDIQSGALWLIFVGDRPLNDDAQFFLRTRVRYVDQ